MTLNMPQPKKSDEGRIEMAIKMIYRCIRCRKPLRDDGTCQNDKCVRYTPEDDKTEASADSGTTATDAASTEKK